MKLSIVIPSIAGREHWLKRALKAFSKTTPVEYETLIYRDFEMCGPAWNVGIEEAQGEYILLAADDLEALPGWYEAGISSLERQEIPSARILNSNGSLQCMGDWIYEVDDGVECELSRIPFAPAHLMREIAPIIDAHYCTDNYFSFRAKKLGWPSVIVREFCFYHHWAEQGRYGHERLDMDIAMFNRETGYRLRSTL